MLENNYVNDNQSLELLESIMLDGTSSFACQLSTISPLKQNDKEIKESYPSLPPTGNLVIRLSHQLKCQCNEPNEKAKMSEPRKLHVSKHIAEIRRKLESSGIMAPYLEHKAIHEQLSYKENKNDIQQQMLKQKK